MLQLGATGLVLLSILDSSFLFLPLGNDLMLVLLVARHHNHFWLYVIAASLGSTAGVFLLDMVCRKGGEEGLTRILSRERLAYVKKKLKERAGIVVIVSCLAPPPFPFTAFIAGASAFQYPRSRLLSLVAAARAARFLLVGWAAIVFGRRILRIANSDEFTWFMIAFATLCIAGSAISVTRWITAGRAGAAK